MKASCIKRNQKVFLKILRFAFFSFASSYGWDIRGIH
jgi:hypothetical protein